ncbi:MAG TPA: hypothetical protein VIY47_02115 [Ignavibacteriaceae bacterium]
MPIPFNLPFVNVLSPHGGIEPLNSQAPVGTQEKGRPPSPTRLPS